MSATQSTQMTVVALEQHVRPYLALVPTNWNQKQLCFHHAVAASQNPMSV